MKNNYKKLLGIAGNPVSHSLSPLFQNYMIERLAIDYIYIPFQVELAHFKNFFKGIQTVENFVGLNVTIPFKEEAYKCCDHLSDIAQEIEAVNTVCFKDKASYGYNTDIWGVVNVIKFILNIESLANKKTIVLGAGGGGRAAVYAVSKLGGKDIYVVCRDKKRQQNINNWAIEKLKLNLRFLDWGNLNNTLKNEEIHLIINATPLGLNGENLPVDFRYLRDYCKIFDMVYTTNETPFVKEAKQKNITAVDGIYMLLYQGIESFKLWTGMSFDIKEVLDYLKGVLNDR
ncbi:MAG: shikimate dehydrogenase [Proteobacteria bacterium]|nr:shikimate dehydrogenase [Pseudomonadota bacterium]